MTTTQTRFFDELAKLMTNAAGPAQFVRPELDPARSGDNIRLGRIAVLSRELSARHREAADARQSHGRGGRRP